MSKKLVKKENNCRVIARQEKQKELLIEQLGKTPITQIACEKLGIARSTFYRWRDEDLEFKEKLIQALIKGKSLINDMAESKLIAGIQNNNMQAITYWLRHNHENYREKKPKLPNDGIQPISLIIETYNPKIHSNVAPQAIDVGPETDNQNGFKVGRLVQRNQEEDEDDSDD